MAARAMISITSGRCSLKLWMMAAAEEPRTKSLATACDECPLRIGGEWEAGASAMLSEATDRQASSLASRWRCHRPKSGRCAGMQRLVKARRLP